MAEVLELEIKAARAERLAWSVMHELATRALLALAAEYKNRATELRARAPE